MKKWRNTLISLRRYPHKRITLIIGVLTVLFFILVLIVDHNTKAGSVISNVFAGLVSGLILSFIGSFKNRDIRDLSAELAFLMDLHEKYLNGNKSFYDYLGRRSSLNEEYYETIYDLVS